LFRVKYNKYNEISKKAEKKKRNKNMNIVIAATAAVTSEIVLSSVVRRCLMYKINSVGDQMCGLLWNLAQMGFGSAERHFQSAEMTKLTYGRDASVPESLRSRAEYDELRRVDLAGSISFVYHIVQDKKKILAKHHNHQNTNSPSSSSSNEETAIVSNKTMFTNGIEDYFYKNGDSDCKRKGSEPIHQCSSPVCTETFQEILQQLEESANVICEQILRIRAEHGCYNKYYQWQKWYYGLQDAPHWTRLKNELPVLDKRIERFLQAIPWCSLVAEQNKN
jgi:hypothetical protein